MAIVFIGTFVAGADHYWSYPKEAITVGFDEQWTIGSYDFEVKEWDSSPIIEFECNGNHYATDESKPGLPVKPVKASLEDMVKDADNKRTFQKFLLEDDSANSLFAVYVVVIGNDVYYSKEKIYAVSNYDLSFEQKENQIVVSHRPQTLSTLVAVAIAALFISCIIGVPNWSIYCFIAKKQEQEGRFK